MEIHHGIDNFKPIKNAIVTSGTFDGVHIGHRVILKRLIDIARPTNGQTVVITFWPHPRFILQPENKSLKLLSTFQEKAAILDEIGVDHLVRITFNRDFSELTSEQFIQKVLINAIETHKLVIGYDHRFGRNREGSFEHLAANHEQYGFRVEEIPRQDIDHVGVSSTKIRKALAEGDVPTATEYLGRQYTITGIVVRGDQIGRTIGFPTANIVVQEEYKLIPADGTYAVKATYKNAQFQGMLNIGFRPTVNGKMRRIELHIFDFEGDLYGEYITIHFVQMLREEMKFADLNALKKQLLQDKHNAQRIFNT